MKRKYIWTQIGNKYPKQRQQDFTYSSDGNSGNPMISLTCVWVGLGFFHYPNKI